MLYSLPCSRLFAHFSVGLCFVFFVLFTPPCWAEEQKKETHESVASALDDGLASFNKVIEDGLFFSVTGDLIKAPAFDKLGAPILDDAGKQVSRPVGFPFIVALLVCGGLFFTFFFRFINFRGLSHALSVIRGKYDDAEDDGEVSHFRAFTSALSATVGLGNIAGVAIAIQVGGPGAVFWMICAAIFGMSLKFNSCTLAQMFRKKNADGSISGGPMYYLDKGLGGPRHSLFVRKLGKVLAILYALMLMGGSFGGGNMFQSNQSFAAVRTTFGVDSSFAHGFGIVLATFVGLVILGGIQRIGAATSRIVPLMVGIYVLAALYVLGVNAAQIPDTFGLILAMAFSKNALYGGTVVVIVKGFQRASFSNEAGIGSAAIAHAAAKTEEPVREGLVAMLGPLVDTVIVCTMTALVVIITGVWNDPVHVGAKGVDLTAAAFGSEVSWFPVVLTISVLMFAYSTMISWAYYGERGWIYLVDQIKEGRGHQTLVVYRVFFVAFVYVGSVSELDNVLLFSDLMILCMALPNIVGGLLLGPQVKRALSDYWKRYC